MSWSLHTDRDTNFNNFIESFNIWLHTNVSLPSLLLSLSPSNNLSHHKCCVTKGTADKPDNEAAQKAEDGDQGQSEKRQTAGEQNKQAATT